MMKAALAADVVDGDDNHYSSMLQISLLKTGMTGTNPPGVLMCQARDQNRAIALAHPPLEFQPSIYVQAADSFSKQACC